MLSNVSTQSEPTSIGARILNWFFGPRLRFKFGALESTVLSIYVVLLTWTLAHHIPWADEAQAWQLSRELSLPALFAHYLRLEGAPGLWYIPLWILARMHVSFLGMRWIMAVFPVAGIWVFLRYSPFPAVLRVTLPFSFYLLYQYGVVSRSYIMLPLLVFTVAILFAQPARNLIALAVVLSLLGNLSAHGFCIAAGLACMLAIRLWRERKRDPQLLTSRRLAIATTCLVACWCFSVWTVFPTLDNRYQPVWYRIHHPNEFVDTQWASVRLPAGTDAGVSETTLDRHIRESRGLKHVFYRYTRAATYGLSNSWVLSSIAIGVLLIYLMTHGNLVDILPYIFLQLLFELVIAHAWHLGALFVAFIGILWIDWPASEKENDPVWRGILSLALLAIVVEQCFWTVHAIRTDVTGKYSGDKDAAAFLASHIEGKRVAGFQYHSVGVLPYFSRNIFYNQPKDAIWYWSKTVPIDERALEVVEERPDYIDIGFAVHAHGNTLSAAADPGWIDRYQPGIEKEILDTGRYVETHRFCGDAFSGHGYDEGECQAILEPAAH
ncbi:MAG: hypothetical protein WBE76_00770 [Terracidiphilus sp.]